MRFEKKKVFQLYQHDKKKKKICRSLLQVTATLCRRDPPIELPDCVYSGKLKLIEAAYW